MLTRHRNEARRAIGKAIESQREPRICVYRSINTVKVSNLKSRFSILQMEGRASVRWTERASRKGIGDNGTLVWEGRTREEGAVVVRGWLSWRGGNGSSRCSRPSAPWPTRTWRCCLRARPPAAWFSRQVYRSWVGVESTRSRTRGPLGLPGSCSRCILTLAGSRWRDLWAATVFSIRESSPSTWTRPVQD